MGAHAWAECEVAKRPIVTEREKREKFPTGGLRAGVAFESGPLNGATDVVAGEGGADDGVGIKSSCRVGGISAEPERIGLGAPGIGVIGVRTFITAKKTGSEGFVPRIVAAGKKSARVEPVVWNAV